LRRLSGTATIAALAVFAFVTFQAATTADASGNPKCATSGLVVWLDTRGNGAAGSIYYQLKFTNLANHACQLLGYPGVSAVDLSGHRLGRAASRNRSHASSVVTLARGGTGAAVLQIIEASNFSRASCHAVTAAGLRVFPPNQTASKVVPFPFRACSRAGPVYLSVRAVSHA